MKTPKKSTPNRIAFIGSYPPRRCGIATFTADLLQAVAATDRRLQCLAVPINDTDAGYPYADHVCFEVVERELASYRRAADFLNSNEVRLVCLQHEYGIFGGPSGSHILALLQELHMPVVTTLHTVFAEPTPEQRTVVERLAELSSRLVVMSERGRKFLEQAYRISPDAIEVIHHGIPDGAFVDSNFYKDRFGVEGRFVILTFGLLSPRKGIEQVIEALPEVVKQHPEVVYIVVGATHPNIIRRDGESYRLSLQRLAKARGVEQHLIFHNRFVPLDELIEFIGAADLYITPYLGEAQITSGTLAYALGAGKAVISTPYWYAEELLADGRGLLVPFGDSGAIARSICEVMEHETERHAMRKRAYQLGRDMVWSEVAARYVETFTRARGGRKWSAIVPFEAKTLGQQVRELPLVKLDHVQRLTDDTGVIQHAVFAVPNYAEGYSTDDNARALILAVLLEEAGEETSRQAAQLAVRYLAFLGYAYNADRGRFRNMMSFDRRWLEDVGSEDAHARSLWALGVVLGRSQHQGLRGPASQLFERALTAAVDFSSPRSWAFTLVAIHEYLRRFFGDHTVQRVRQELAERLLTGYQACRTADWIWFEDVLAYANAKLPHAMLLSGRWLERDDMLEAGLETLGWLADLQQDAAGHFVPVGSNGFYRRGGQRARFDQQPVEAHAMVSACLEAHRITGDARWQHEAERAFDWFLGENDLNKPLYDPETGGCRDGLHPDRVNENQGTEATLAFLLSLVEFRLSEQAIHVEGSADVQVA